MRRDSLRAKNVLSGLIAPEKYPLVYFNIPKSGCTTIKNVLYYIDNGRFLDDPITIHRQIKQGNCLLSRSHFSEKLRERLEGKRFLFTFVRDPLSRAYSCFNEKICNVGPYAFGLIAKWLMENGFLAVPENGSLKDCGLDLHRENFRSFLRFVELNMAGKTPLRRDPHWLPQMLLLQGHLDTLLFDFVGRTETYRRDIGFVLDAVGFNDGAILNARFNEGPAAPHALAQVVDDDLISLSHRIYAADYSAFGSFG